MIHSTLFPKWGLGILTGRRARRPARILFRRGSARSRGAPLSGHAEADRSPCRPGVRPIRTLTLAGAALAVLSGLSGPARADAGLLVILDSSNSMWGQLEGVAKVELARGFLGDLLSELPANSPVGLIAYGHRRSASCGDVELVHPLAPGAADAVSASVQRLKPRGATPLAGSLRTALQALRSAGLDSGARIVLVTDGVESCGGDPCAEAAAIGALDPRVEVHVVGVGIAAEDRAELQCVADSANGRYFPADDAETLGEVLAELSALRVSADRSSAPTPPSPGWREIFFDDFSEADLSPAWTVRNADESGWTLWNDGLMLASSRLGTIEEETLPNVFELNVGIPDGDWRLTARLEPLFRTGRDSFQLGISERPDRFVRSVLSTDTSLAPQDFAVQLFVVRRDDTDYTYLSSVLVKGADIALDGPGAPWKEARFLQAASSPVQVRLEKRGTSYYAAMLREDGGAEGSDAGWIETLPLALALAGGRGKPFLTVNQWEEAFGRTYVLVDWVRLEAWNGATD